MSKHWIVSWHCDATGTVFVKADTAEEAQKISENGLEPERDDIEIGDPVNVVSVSECTAGYYKQNVRTYNGKTAQELNEQEN